MRYRVVFWLLVLAAIWVALSGGFRTQLAGVRVSVQWPTGLTLVAWLLFIVRREESSRSVFSGRALNVVWRWGGRHRWAAPTSMAVVVALAGLGYGALVAAGADPYGYVSQALLWGQGNPLQFQPAAMSAAAWRAAAWSACPLGYKPAHIAGLIAPTYAIGLPLQMAMLVHIFGFSGSFLVVPLLGGVTVWATYQFGCRVCGDRQCALLSALLIACSPVFLYQLMQPMSDVPVTAWWLLAILAAIDGGATGALGAGLYSSLAILTRPNLSVLVIPVAAYLLFGRRRRLRLWRELVLYGAGVVPGVLLTAAANQTFFGSPLISGYGSLTEIYHARNLIPNLLRYPHWLYTTHSVLPFIGLGAALAASTVRNLDPERRAALLRSGLLGGAFAITLFASYGFYIPFDHWSYLRFMLPTIPILIALGVATIEAVSAAVSARARRAALALVVIVLPLYCLSFAWHGNAFALKPLFEDRYVVAAKAVAAITPPSAVVIGLNQSGSLRLYANRLTVRYDVLGRSAPKEIVEFFGQRGRPVYVALESTEREDFRHRFGAFGEEVPAGAMVFVDPLHLVSLIGPLNAGSTNEGAKAQTTN